MKNGTNQFAWRDTWGGSGGRGQGKRGKDRVGTKTPMTRDNEADVGPQLRMCSLPSYEQLRPFLAPPTSYHGIMGKEGQNKDMNNLKTGWDEERRNGSLNAPVRKTARWCDCVRLT